MPVLGRCESHTWRRTDVTWLLTPNLVVRHSAWACRTTDGGDAQQLFAWDGQLKQTQPKTMLDSASSWA
jgi:hypothetical protein